MGQGDVLKKIGAAPKPANVYPFQDITTPPDTLNNAAAPAIDQYGCRPLPPLQDAANWNSLNPYYLDYDAVSTPDYEEPVFAYQLARDPAEKEDAFRELFTKLITDTDLICLHEVYQQKIHESTNLVAKGTRDETLDKELETVAFKIYRILSDIEGLVRDLNGSDLGEKEYWVMIEELEALGIYSITSSYLERIKEVRREEAKPFPPKKDTGPKIEDLSADYKKILQKGSEVWAAYTGLTQELSLQSEIVSDFERQNQEDIDTFNQGVSPTKEEAERLFDNAQASAQQLSVAREKLGPLEFKLQKLEGELLDVENRERAQSSAIIEALVKKHGIKGIVDLIAGAELQVKATKSVLSCYEKNGEDIEGCERFLQSDDTRDEAAATLTQRKEDLARHKLYLAEKIEQVKKDLLTIRRAAIGIDGTEDSGMMDISLSATDHAQYADSLVLAGAKKEAAAEYEAAARLAGTTAEEQLYTVLALQLDPARLKDHLATLNIFTDGIPFLRGAAQTWNPESQNCTGMEVSDFPKCRKAPGTPEQVEVLNGVLIGALYEALSFEHNPEEDPLRELALVGLETRLKEAIHHAIGKATPLVAAVLMEDVDKVLFRYTAPGGRLAQIRQAQDEKAANSKHQDIWGLVLASENLAAPLQTASPDDPFTNRLIAQKWHLFIDGQLNGFEKPYTAIQAASGRVFKPYADSQIVKTILREFKLRHPEFVVAGAPNVDIDKRYSTGGRLAGNYALSSELLRGENTRTAGKAGMGAGLAAGIISACLSEGLTIPFLIGGLIGGSAYAGTDYAVAANSTQYDQALRTGFSLHNVLDYDRNIGSFGMSTFFAGLESAMWWTPVGAVGGFGTRVVLTKGTPKAIAALKGAAVTAAGLGVRGTAARAGSALWSESAAFGGALVRGARTLPILRASYMAPAARWLGTRAHTWWQQFSLKQTASQTFKWGGKQFGKGHRWKTGRVLTGAALTSADLFAIDKISLDENNLPSIQWGTDYKIDTIVGTIGALMLISEGAQSIFHMPTGGTYVTAGFRAGTEQIMLKQQGLPLTTLDPSRLIFGVVESRTVEFFIASFIRGEEFLKEFKLGRMILAGGKAITSKVPGVEWLTRSLIQRGDRGIVGWVPKKEKAREVRSVTLVEEQVGGQTVVRSLEGDLVQTVEKAADGSGRLTVRVKQTRPDGSTKLVDVNARRYKSGEGMPEETRLFLAQHGIHINPESGQLFALNNAENLWQSGLGIKLKHRLQSVTIPADKLAKKRASLPEKWQQRVQKDGSLTLTNKDIDDLPDSIRGLLKTSGVLANHKDGFYTVGNGAIVSGRPQRRFFPSRPKRGRSPAGSETAKPAAPQTTAQDTPSSKYYNGLRLNFFRGETIPDEVTVLKPAYRTTTTSFSGRKVTSLNEVDPLMRAKVTTELAERGVYVDASGKFFTLRDAPNRNLTGALVMPGQKAPVVYFDPQTGSYSTLTGIDPLGLWGKTVVPSEGAALMALEKVPLKNTLIGAAPGMITPICTGRDGKYQFTVRGSGMMFGYVAPIVGAFNFWLFAPAQGGDPSYQLGQRLTNYGITIFFTWPVIQWPLGFWTPEAEAVGRAVGIPVNIFANRVYPNKRNQFPGWQTFYDDINAQDYDSAISGTSLGITNFGGFLTQATSLNMIPSHVNGDHGEWVLDEFEGPALETWRDKMDKIIADAEEQLKTTDFNPANLPQTRWLEKFALVFDNYYQREVTGDLDTPTRRMLRIWAAYIKSTALQYGSNGTNTVMQPFHNLIKKYPAIFNRTPVLKSAYDWDEFIGKINSGKDPAINFHIEPIVSTYEKKTDLNGKPYIDVPGGRLFIFDDHVELLSNTDKPLGVDTPDILTNP